MTKKKMLLTQLNRYYPIHFHQIHLLRKGSNQVYRAEGEGGSYLLKVVGPTFRETARQSARIVQYLHGHGLTVPEIIPTSEGGFSFSSPGQYGETLSLLFPFLEGREPKPGEKIEEIGLLTGRLHRLMEQYPEKLADRGKPFFIDRYIDLLRLKHYPERKLSELVETGEALWASVEGLPHGYCHGDLHRGNFLLTPEGQLYLLDFDTSCMAYPMFDIAVMCDATDYFTFDPAGLGAVEQSFECFLAGYERVRALAQEERASLYAWIAIRHYQLQATILEMHGLDCVDEAFLDQQFVWLRRWREQCGLR